MLYILIIVLSALGSFFLPWWIIAPISFLLCAWKAETGGKAFVISAAAITTLWLGYALYLNFSTGGVMSSRIASLFTAGSPTLSKLPQTALLSIIMILIGVNVAGFAGTAGYYFRQLFNK